MRRIKPHMIHYYYDTKEEDIRSVFEDCGTIQEIRLPVYFFSMIF